MRILITGANRGLGLALVRVGSEKGHHIFAGVRKLEKCHEIFAGIGIESNFNVIPLDITNEHSVEEAAKYIKNLFESIDVIINNAGILLDRDKALEEIDLGNVERTFDVNLFGPMRVVKHFLPLLKEGVGSSIINVSSEAGSFQNAYGGDYAYAESKTALNMFSKQLKSYLEPKQIRVYAIHPGWIKTDMGGEHAPGNPLEAARAIFNIIENPGSLNGEHIFMTANGEPMSF